MGEVLGFFNLLKASGMPHADALEGVLGGALGRPVGLGEVLLEFQDPRQALRLAREGALLTGDLEGACAALVARGIHPLSLLLGGDPGFHPWVGACVDPGRFHSLGAPFETGFRRGQVTFRNFRPADWLRELPPGLAAVCDPEVDTLVIADSSLGEVLRPDLDLGLHLRLQGCRGRTRLPSRIRGRLQLRFCEAAFQFPIEQNLDGALDIVGCPGATVLPESLRTEGLYLQMNPNLTNLPLRLEGARQIDLASLPAPAFPAGVRNLSYLRLCRLPHLRTLPLPSGDPLDVHLLSLPALRRIELPAEGVLRELTVSGCDHLEALPDGLVSITGSLTLSRLPSLSRLPEGLRVEGDLRIQDCPALLRLPKGLSVGGDLQLLPPSQPRPQAR
jgi:hypothetical protein